jgi:hypothetical protein
LNRRNRNPQALQLQKVKRFFSALGPSTSTFIIYEPGLADSSAFLIMYRLGGKIVLLRHSRKHILATIDASSSSVSSNWRTFAWQGHGTDLLNDALSYGTGGIPKIVLHGYGATGVDVVNMIKNKDPSDRSLLHSRGIVHMAGSILAFPSACFLWKVRTVADLTIESLAPVLLHTPKMEYLFVGSKTAIPPETIQKLRKDFAAAGVTMVVEPMDMVCDR